VPLTDVVISNAKPCRKAIRLFDGGGLYLEVSLTGGKWWRLKYRFFGKEKRLSLGVYPSARSNGRPMSDTAILAAMRRMGIGKDEMSRHGFRAVARTILDEVLGVRP
jgi:Arm DNA-binding domain